MGVVGRYTARLSLAECCDVCPVTGTVRNPEGFATFKQLHDSTLSGAPAPVFKARVVSVETKGGEGGGKKGKKQAHGGAFYDIELTVSAVGMGGGG